MFLKHMCSYAYCLHPTGGLFYLQTSTLQALKQESSLVFVTRKSVSKLGEVAVTPQRIDPRHWIWPDKCLIFRMCTLKLSWTGPSLKIPSPEHLSEACPSVQNDKNVQFQKVKHPVRWG